MVELTLGVETSVEFAYDREVIAESRRRAEYLLVTRNARAVQSLEHRGVQVAVVELVFDVAARVLKRGNEAMATDTTRYRIPVLAMTCAAA